MPVPDRGQWQKWRDAAGVPKGFGRHDMGPAFEKYHKSAKPGVDYKVQYAAAVALRKVCLDYYADLLKSKDHKVKAFAAVFDKKIYQDLLKFEASIKQMAQPTLKLKTELTHLLQAVAGVKDKDTWYKFWNTYVRGVGTMRQKLKDALPPKEYNAFDTAFPVALTAQAYLSKGQQSDNDRKACVKEVLQYATSVNNAAHQYGWW